MADQERLFSGFDEVHPMFRENRKRGLFLIQFLQEIKVMNSTKWENFCKKFHFDFRTTLLSSLSCFQANVLQIVNSTKWESFPLILIIPCITSPCRPRV